MQALSANIHAAFDEEFMMGTQRDSGSDLSPRNVADRLKEEGKQRLERGKSTAADQVDSVANALKSASHQLGGDSRLGSYTDRLAQNIEHWSSRLRHGSIEELADDIQAAARRNPALFVAGGLALGVVLARMVRAARPGNELYYEGEYDEFTAGGYSRGDMSSGPSRNDITSSGDAGTTPDPTRGTFGG